jgi:hypothetical protein
MRINKSDRYSILASLPNYLAKPGNKKQPRNPRVTIKERDIQSMSENLCHSLGIRFFRIPDTLLTYLKAFAPEWTRVFIYRYLSGVPDMMLFKKSPNGDNICRFIEIKTEAGKIHQSQAKWHSGLNVHVCYGWEQTEKAIKEF